LEATTRIVLTNRTNPPVTLSEGYKRIAGYTKEALRR